MDIRMGDPKLSQSLDRAFAAAEVKGFHLLLSFDYAGGGPFPLEQVVSHSNGCGKSAGYFRYDGKPFVAAWPWRNTDMNTYVDASYLQFLNDTSPDLKYMMPVSPWFSTNLPGYNKNWIWRGE